MDIIISSPPANSKCLPITPRSDTDETWEGFQLELTRQNFFLKKKWENDARDLKNGGFMMKRIITMIMMIIMITMIMMMAIDNLIYQ